jgi:hypothetical protein
MRCRACSGLAKDRLRQADIAADGSAAVQRWSAHE